MVSRYQCNSVAVVSLFSSVPQHRGGYVCLLLTLCILVPLSLLIPLHNMSLPVPEEEQFCQSARDAPLHPLQLKKGMLISVATQGGEPQERRKGTVQHMHRKTGALKINWHEGGDDSLWPLTAEQLKSVPYECPANSRGSDWGSTPIYLSCQAKLTMQCPWTPHEVLMHCAEVGIDMDTLHEGHILQKNSLQDLLKASTNSKRADFEGCTLCLLVHLCANTHCVCL